VQNAVVHKNYRYCTCEKLWGPVPLGWGWEHGVLNLVAQAQRYPMSNCQLKILPKILSHKLAHYELTLKISSQSVHNFLCYRVQKQTN